jgi:flagellar M-ring protein FliF
LRKESTTNYEVDKTIKHVKSPVGVVKRLSVAVVVNHRDVAEDDGKPGLKPLSQEEMAQLTDLIKEAVGFSKERGDTLNVVNSAFNAPLRIAAPELPLWKQPEVLALANDVGKHLVIALVAIALALGVLRPLLKRLAQPAPIAIAGPPDEGPSELSEANRTLALGNLDQNVQTAKQIALQDPKVVANVVKGWMAGDEQSRHQ